MPRTCMNKINYSGALIRTLALLLLILAVGCREAYAPKPRGYFKLDFPEKQYERYTSPCGFSFDYPVYGKVDEVTLSNAEPCWYDVNFDQYRASIHLTYKPINKDLSGHIEDIRRIVYKHIIKADDIIETRIDEQNHKTWGILYDIKGNAASSVNFFITDSTSGFLSGSLYFNVEPNIDSLAPAIQFFREDIVHLISSFSWE
jgi:gliding motility-associated lipoprotein GldD